MSAPNIRNFDAWINLQPPGPFELIVVGEVETKSSADIPVLTPDDDGGAGKTLRLVLTIKNTGGIGTQAFQYRDARHEQQAQQGEFTQVDILWLGVVIATLPVREVH